MTKRALKYGSAGNGYISTPSFAIPNTGIITVEAWMKSKLNVTYYQAVVAMDNTSID